MSVLSIQPSHHTEEYKVEDDEASIINNCVEFDEDLITYVMEVI